METVLKDSPMELSNYKHAIDQATIVSITNQKGEFTYVNDNFIHISGYSYAQMIGQNHRLINSGVHDKEFFKEMWDTIINGNIWRGEICNRAKDGSIFWVDNTIVPLKNEKGEPIQFIELGKDITDKKDQQRIINEYNHQLRQLASHLEDIREEERHQMALSIHEELGQQLTALKLEVSCFQSQLRDESFRQTNGGILELINKSIVTVRQIADDLRPSILYDLGLIEALQWQSREFGKRSGIQTTFVNNAGEINLPSKPRLTLFRIFQESLTNIARYAEASQVFSMLKTENEMLYLIVQDDGKGFDPKLLNAGKAFGLAWMKERVISMNGRLDINTAPGQGTTISIIIPEKKS
jgi:two-component system sensor histidine kinase NreB